MAIRRNGKRMRKTTAAWHGRPSLFNACFGAKKCRGVVCTTYTVNQKGYCNQCLSRLERVEKRLGELNKGEVASGK